MIIPTGCISEPPRALASAIAAVPVFNTFINPMVLDPSHKVFHFEFLDTLNEEKDSEDKKESTERLRPTFVIMTNQNGNFQINRGATNTVTWSDSLYVSCEVNRSSIIQHINSEADEDITLAWTNFIGALVYQIVATAHLDGGICVNRITQLRWGRNKTKQRSGKGDFHGANFLVHWGVDGV